MQQFNKKFPYIKLVQPEKLKLEEEISLIYNSKIVIGTYGAALINVLFARPDTTFVRLIVNKTDKNDFKNDLYKEVSMFEAIAATKKMRIVNMNVEGLNMYTGMGYCPISHRIYCPIFLSNFLYSFL